MLKTGGLHPISERQGPIAPGCSKCSGKWPSKCINLHQDASYHWENMGKLTLMMMMMNHEHEDEGQAFVVIGKELRESTRRFSLSMVNGNTIVPVARAT